MRTCTNCAQTKPLDAFWRDSRRKSGRMAQCKICRTTKFSHYRKAADYEFKRYWRDPAAARERHLKRKYGVTLAEYERMHQAQGGKCAICGKTPKRALDIDHCHKTGRVRGLLCTSCNRMIGHAGDSPENLRAAAAYLQMITPSAGKPGFEEEAQANA